MSGSRSVDVDVVCRMVLSGKASKKSVELKAAEDVVTVDPTLSSTSGCSELVGEISERLGVALTDAVVVMVAAGVCHTVMSLLAICTDEHHTQNEHSPGTVKFPDISTIIHGTPTHAAYPQQAYNF